VDGPVAFCCRAVFFVWKFLSLSKDRWNIRCVVRRAAGSFAAKHQPWFGKPMEAPLRSTNRGLAGYFFL